MAETHSGATPALDAEVAATGVAALDDALGGLFWGDNVVFTGAWTVPGVGVPMVLISGRLAAQRCTDFLPAATSRSPEEVPR